MNLILLENLILTLVHIRIIIFRLLLHLPKIRASVKREMKFTRRKTREMGWVSTTTTHKITFILSFNLLNQIKIFY